MRVFKSIRGVQMILYSNFLILMYRQMYSPLMRAKGGTQ